MKQHPTVVIYGSHDSDKQVVSELESNFRFIFEKSPIQEVSPIEDAEIVVLFSDSKFDSHHITPSLKAVICRSTGTDNVFCKTSLKKKGIRLFRGETYATRSVTEYLLACSIDSIYGPYLDHPTTGRDELGGKKLVVVGTGRIGSNFSSIMSKIGADVTLVSSSALRDEELSVILSQADIITINTSLREDNVMMCDTEFFGRVKPGLIFINISRGEHVKNSVLLQALESGVVSKAYLDVLTEDEFALQLKRHARVCFTSYTAWKTPQALARSKEYLLTTLNELRVLHTPR